MNSTLDATTAPTAAEPTTRRPLPAPLNVQRAFQCLCGRPVFFRNSRCLACGTELGYDPQRAALLPLARSDQNGQQGDGGLWVVDTSGGAKEYSDGKLHAVYQRCMNLDTPAACNWLVDVSAQPSDQGSEMTPSLCTCCRLTRTVPDLALPNSALWWGRIELAKRRMVSSLIGLKLPVLSKVDADPARGLVFDLLRAAPGEPAVITGHDDGVITLDVAEADDAWREQRRAALGEPYRTLLGHLRHESGHYYWQRLVENTPMHEAFRQRFGDERIDYMGALKAHYEHGAPADWNLRHVSAYASCHPWEDWAETWAHYLHMVDTLDTARSFGVDGSQVELTYEAFTNDDLQDPADDEPEVFMQLVHGWMQLTGVLNELSRSMGVHDFYPFVLSKPMLSKLHLVHRVVQECAAAQATNVN